jgi:hypothetical protein
MKPGLAGGEALLTAGYLFGKLRELDVIAVRAIHGR